MNYLSIHRAILAVVLVSFVLPGCQAEEKKTYLVGNLEPGPYAVGFKVVHTYDYTETWVPQYDENDFLIRKENPRPMQIAIWYPASGTNGSHPMPYKEYWYLDATRVDFKELTDEDKKQLDQAFINMRGSGQANPEIRQHILNAASTAYRNVPVKDGNFPLVLYVPREYRGVYLNSVLCEFLASHGFIVAATPNKDRTNHIQQSLPTADILDAYLGDLKFVAAYMRDFPSVNVNKLGTIGYWAGAMAPMLLAQRHPNVHAMVSFDGLLASPMAKNVLDTVSYYEPKGIRAPLMHLTSALDRQGNPAKFDYGDEFLYIDRYFVRIQGATHLGFSSFFNTAWLKSEENPDRYNYEEIDRGYDTAAIYTLHFLNTYLKGDRASKEFIADSQMDYVEVTKTGGLQAPPTEVYFIKMFTEQGPEAAWKRYQEVKEIDPDYKIFTANAINNLGYTLIGQGEFEKAVSALELYADAYPQDANAFDSLGEGYMAAGMREKAIESFQKSLQMMPAQNVRDNSIKLLRELGVSIEEDSPDFPLFKAASRKNDELYPQAPPFDDPSRVSPNRSVSGKIGHCDISIEYGAPYVRGRTLVGGLISTYRAWRTGANEATIITFSEDVRIEGRELKAGAYGLFTIAGADEWTVIFNKVANQWGAFTYDARADALRVNVKPGEAEHQEEMKFEIQEGNDGAGEVVLRWGTLSVPFKIQTDSH